MYMSRLRMSVGTVINTDKFEDRNNGAGKEEEKNKTKMKKISRNPDFVTKTWRLAVTRMVHCH